MATKAVTTISAEHVYEALRQHGQLTVRVNGSPILFEVTRRGVEVSHSNDRYVMYQERDISLDHITFRVTVDGRWECLATQEGFDGMSYFEVIDKAGDPFAQCGEYGTVRESAYFEDIFIRRSNERRKVLLLCQ